MVMAERPQRVYGDKDCFEQKTGQGAKCQAAAKAAGRKRSRWYQNRPTAAVTAVLAVAYVTAGYLVYVPHQHAGIDLVKLQWWAGSTKEAMSAIRGQPADLFRMALNWD
jgi:hypothetical protein